MALALAVGKGVAGGRFQRGVLTDQVAAVSVGMVDKRALLDLCYTEDAAADVDMNVAMLKRGRFVEVQATGEGGSFDAPELQQMLQLARRGIRQLLAAQKQALGKEAKP